MRFGFILADYDYNMACINEKKEEGTIKMKIMTTRKIKDKEEHDKITDYLYKNIYKPRLDNIDNQKI